MGAFQVRQFLLTSYARRARAPLRGRRVFRRYVAARHLQRQDVRRAGDGNALAVPSACSCRSNRSATSTCCIPRGASGAGDGERESRTSDGGCRLATLERVLCGVHARRRRAGHRDPGALLPVPAQRRCAAARAGARAQSARPRLAGGRHGARGAARRRGDGSGCRDAAEALALGKVYERAGARRSRDDVLPAAAERARARTSTFVAEALYRLGLRLRRDRRFADAADCWRAAGTEARPRADASPLLPRCASSPPSRSPIHHEHRERDYEGAQGAHAPAARRIRERVRPNAEANRRRLARLDRKIARTGGELFAR